MSEPTIAPSVIKKLLSLDTPVAHRIIEIALMVGLIWFCTYVGEHNKGNSYIEFAVGVVGVFGGLMMLVLMGALLFTIIVELKKTLPPDTKR